MSKAASDRVAELQSNMKNSLNPVLNRGRAIIAAVFALFLLVFPRPKLVDQDKSRVATVVADYFAVSILYHGSQFIYNFANLTPLGLQNYTWFLCTLFVIRYLTTKGSLKIAIGFYSFSVAYFYILTSLSLQYLEHAQISGLLIVTAFATLTMGAMYGLFILCTLTAVLYGLLAASNSLGFTSLSALTEAAAPASYEIQLTVINMVKIYILSALVRSHIFSQLTSSLLRERGVAAKEQEARKEAEFANREKTRFISSASHDLRQPVSTLALSFESYVEDNPDAMNNDAICNMGASIDTLHRMLESILTVSKLQANVIKPNLSNVSIDSLLQRCYSANVAAATQKGLSLRVRTTDIYCDTDGEMLFRALNNIVDNAVKYTRSGGIIVGVRRRYGGYAICVMDSGIGIPADSIDKIYDEFTMLVDSSRKSTGSGLGLTIVKRTCELLGMKIHTRSKLGVGSTFYIHLPEGSVKHIAVPKATPSRRTLESQPMPVYIALNGLLVGVVDDVDDVRLTICKVLQRHGLRTVGAANWEELKKGFKQENPDILITDFKLENNVTGYDVILAARKQYSPSLPCFIITGDTSPDLVREMSQRGVDICYKPLTSKALLGAMKKQLHIA